MDALKVAVIGASGIGKNHARWFHNHGCSVCAFVGSSDATVEKTHQVLQDGFGFEGRGYTNVETMLQESKPDIVCIASPPPQHFTQAMTCLQHGAHILCEKPLVYDPSLSHDELIAQAELLASEAQKRKLIFGTQMQYGPATKYLLQSAGVESDDVGDYEMVMETKNIKDKRDFEQIWIDLSPHPLSVLQKLSPQGKLSNIEATIGERESKATFTLQSPKGNIHARIVVRFDPDANPPQRYFAFNERKVGYAGRKNALGEFVTYLTAPDGKETELPDLVDLLIGDFVRACHGEIAVPVSGAEGAQNVRWQQQIASKARRI